MSDLVRLALISFWNASLIFFSLVKVSSKVGIRVQVKIVPIDNVTFVAPFS